MRKTSTQPKAKAMPRPSLSYLEVLRLLMPFTRNYRGIIVVSLLLTFLGASIAQVTPLAIQYVVNEVSKLIEGQASLEGAWTVFLLGGSLLLGKEVVSLVINISARYLGEKLKVLMGADLSNEAYARLIFLDLRFFDTEVNEVGKVTKRVDRGAELLAKAVKNLFVDIIPLLTNAAFALIVMFTVNVWVGLTSSLIIPIYFYLSWTQAKKQRGVRGSIQETQENRTSGMFNVLSAIKLVKSYIREEFEIQKHRRLNEDLARAEVRHHRVNHVYDSLKLFFDQVGVVIIVIVTAILVLQGQMAIGAIMLHLLLYNNITAPIRGLHRIYDETNEAIAYAEGFFAIFNIRPEISSTDENGDGLPAGIMGEVEFRNVFFAYVDDQDVLHNISIKLPSGKTTALIGLSGAGKTTIANLIGRFYDVERGEVLLDGKPISRYPKWFVRKHIGFVLQQNHIFPGSIMENIRYGNLSASDYEVIEAAKRAGLHEEVIALRDGYASSATRLSGGQMQRIAIARMFLKDPSVLVLDEPTASLDAIAAERIKGAIDALRTERTVLIISHNLASIVDSDWIYVIEKGRIIGQGTHDSLMQENVHYRMLIDANVRNMNLEVLVDSVRNVGQSKRMINDAITK